MTQTFTYTSASPITATITVVAASAATAITSLSGPVYGYAIVSISGTYNGQTITGMYGSGGTYDSSDATLGAFDNTIISTGDATGGGGGSLYGIDLYGIAFSLANGQTVLFRHYPVAGLPLLEFRVNTGSSVTTSYPTITSTAVCYLRGTRILTATGDVAVEDLREGDMIVTLFGKLRPLKWVGGQGFHGWFLGKAHAPICFRAGSIAENVPNRDLYVSPAHSVMIGGKLVIADLLVNGVTVTQAATDERVDYFHLDLGQHDCVIANGAWAESYAAHNNRNQFHNLAEFEVAFPGVIETEVFQPLCLPLIAADDPTLAQIRAQLLARVPDDRFTTDADVHLLADGIRIDAEHSGANEWVFDVPAGVRNVRLMSRACRPSSLGMNGDDRMLGFCLSEVSVLGGPTLRNDDAWFVTGVHEPESDGVSVWRWTNGDCALPNSLFAGAIPATLTLRGRTMEQYFLPIQETERLAA